MTSSSRATGRIEVSELVAGDDLGAARPTRRARDWWATPPTATTIARPIASAPTVSVVRLRSRTIDGPGEALLDAEDAAGTAGPASRPSAPSTNGDDEDGAEEQRGRRRPIGRGPPMPSVARPDEEPGDADGDEDRRRASAAGRAGRRPARAGRGAPRPARSSRPAGPARGGRDRHGEHRSRRRARSTTGLGSTRSNGIDPIVRSVDRHQLGEHEPGDEPEERAEDARGRPPGRGRTRRAGRGSRPAARSRPSSRTRSVTVIDSVLKIRNAPTNRATAAISAVVDRKSAVEPRSDAARSRRRGQDVRLARQRDARSRRRPRRRSRPRRPRRRPGSRVGRRRGRCIVAERQDDRPAGASRRSGRRRRGSRRRSGRPAPSGPGT